MICGNGLRFPFRNNTLNFHGDVIPFDAHLPRSIPSTAMGGSNLTLPQKKLVNELKKRQKLIVL
jgi:hypothetical protein